MRRVSNFFPRCANAPACRRVRVHLIGWELVCIVPCCWMHRALLLVEDLQQLQQQASTLRYSHPPTHPPTMHQFV